MKRLNLAPIAGILALLVLGSTLACDSGDDDDDSAQGGTDDDAGATDDDAADDDAADDDAADDDAGDDDASPAEWTWQTVDGAVCRDGSAAGYAVRLGAKADNLVVFLQGGGACYDPDSCADNPAQFGEADLAGWAAGDGQHGMLNATRDENPVKDWNFVYVPYCTGDLHAGSQVDGAAPGVDGAQQFVGYQNIKKFLPAIKDQFSGAAKVLLAGESAGGFGTVLNYAQVANAFSGVPVVLIDDSGPLFESNAVLAPCLQLLVAMLWNVDPAIADGCADCIQWNGDGFSGWHPYLAEQYPLGTFGLFSSTEDATIRDFFGIGQNFCTGTTDIPADVYAQGLLDMRDDLLLPTGRWSTYYIPGDTHTALPDETLFYETKIGDTALTGWVEALLSGVPPAVGPDAK